MMHKLQFLFTSLCALMQFEGTIGLRGQEEFGHAKAFLFQANLPDELTRFPPQTLP